MAKEAEIKALQAQINPHFLFNSMNIIVSLIRTNPDQARKLLTSLSYFLRQNVTGTTASQISLEQEFSHVKAYLEIIEARFVDRLTILYDVDDTLCMKGFHHSHCSPSLKMLSIMALMIWRKIVLFKMTVRDLGEEIEIKVEDNGKGISPERIAILGRCRLSLKRELV